MTENIVHIPVEKLRKFMIDVFTTVKDTKGNSVPQEEAEIIADILMASDLHGITSHGVQRLKMYYDRLKAGQQFAKTEITTIKETETTATLDANHGMGHVAAYNSMKIAIKKAKKYGIGGVAITNSTHFGIAGYFPLMAIEEGCIGICCTNARPSIAPTFGIEPMMGTNPLTFGIPTDEEFPFLLDCATSITQRGKIEVKSRTADPVPEGWVINKDGDLAIDSVKILEDLGKGDAALLPLGGAGEILGGHKGYGYAAVVEILSAALSGGPFMKDLTLAKGYKLGHFFLAINIESFISIDIFKKIAGNICRSLRDSKKAPGQDRIYTAGEKEYYSRKALEKSGIPINKSIQDDLLQLAKELDLKKEEYGFTF